MERARTPTWASSSGPRRWAARLWRLRPGQASTRHRHSQTAELYVLLEGTGRMRVDDELLTLAPLDTVSSSRAIVRQLFNDTECRPALADRQGRRTEAANTLEMTEEAAARGSTRTGPRRCRRSSAGETSTPTRRRPR